MSTLTNFFANKRPTIFGFSLLIALEQYVHFQWPFQGEINLILFFGVQVVVFAAAALVFRIKSVKFPIEATLSGTASFAVAIFLVYSITGSMIGDLGTVIFGVLFAFLYLPWFRVLGKLGTLDAFICLFGSQVIASLLVAVVVFMPSNAEIIIFAVCTLGSFICSLDANRDKSEPNLPKARYEGQRFREPVLYGILIFLFGISAGYFNQSDMGWMLIEPHQYFGLWSALAALLSAICIVVVVKGRIEPNLSLVWRLFVIAMLVCLVGTQAFPDSPIGKTAINCIVCALRTVVLATFTVAMIDIARYARWKPTVVLCTGYAISILSFLVPEIASAAIGTPLSTLPLLWALIFIIVGGSLLLVQEKDFSSARVFAELCTTPTSSSSPDTMLAKASAVAQQYGLSKREEEVLRYLGAGRTRGYIAETLFISESTVASHSKRIYQKLNVHSKGELMDLMDSTDA